MNKKVALIIITYNQNKLLEKCISSLKNLTSYKNYKVYLVDDSGTGKIGKEMKEKFKFVNVIINKENLGCSKSYNLGMKEALKDYNPDYFVLLNDDLEFIQKNWLKEMIKVGEGNKKIGILSCKIIYPDGSLQSIGGYLNNWEIARVTDFKDGSVFDVDHVMGACMLIKKEVIKKIGLLDEDFSPYLLEDTDYCLRAKEDNFKIKIVSYVEVIHKKGKTIDSLKNKKNLMVRFKNDILFSRKHLKGFNKFFRIFIYLLLVAIFKKKKDTGRFEIRNLKLRKEFLRNIYLLVLSFNPEKHKKIWNN